MELAGTSDGRRRLRRATLVNSYPAAIVEREHARRLIDLAGGDQTLAQEIGTLLIGLPHDQPLPQLSTLIRRLRSGVPGALTMPRSATT